MTDEYPWRIEQLAAAIAIFSHANIRSTRAGSALREAMIQLQNPSPLTQETLDGLGIETKDESGNILPLDEIIARLDQADLAHADYWKIFGIQAGATIAALVRYGPEPLRNLAREVLRSPDRDQLLSDTRRLVGPPIGSSG